VILSNVEIHRALDEGRLRITPEPSPRFPSLAHPDCPYNTTSVDLRLGPRLHVPKTSAYAFDLRGGGIASFLTDISSQLELDAQHAYILQPNQFTLGQTLEEVEFPIDRGEPVLSARIEGRSSFARCGLLVHFTAPTVHAGFKGTLTLEMRNLGPAGIVLFPGMPICQLIIEEVRGVPVENPSQFQGQTTPPGR
jgi:dCTP deaminase